MQDEVIQGFRLSPQQARLWRLQQAESLPYRVWGAVAVEGRLDADALEAAVRAVVMQHEILRTTFQKVAGLSYPVQVIHDDADPTFQRHDLSDMPAGEERASVEALLHEAGHLPFDVERGPLLRVAVARFSSGKHLLVLSVHALCADLAGLAALVGEIARAYADSSAGAEESEELMQYADVSEVLNDLLESGETAAGRDYWSKQGVEDSAFLKLPLEEAPGDKHGFEPCSSIVSFAPSLAAGVKAAAAVERVSVPEFLQAAWNVLLYKLTARADITVGTAYPGRTYEGLNRAPGLFARFLPLSCHLENDSQFKDILKQVRESAQGAREWQEYFTWEHDASTHSDGGASAQFFPLNFESVEQPAPLRLAGLLWTLDRHEGSTDRFQLKLRCLTSAEGDMRAELHYDAAQYSGDSIERLSRQYQTLLSGIVENPSTTIEQLDILDARERRTLLVDFNQTAQTFHAPDCLHQLFEAQATRAPDALALISDQDQHTLSYAQLDERANRLAHLLIASGISPESPVALLLERSTGMLVSILAVLKAGAAYLPLDPEYPSERLAFMLRDAAPYLLLTDSALAHAHTMTLTGITVLTLDTMTDGLAAQPVTNPDVTVDPDSLAYLIYTSGSTGTPKAVCVSHRSINNRLLWMHQEFPLFATDRVLQKTAYSFDASIWEMFLPLLCGAQVVLARAGGQRDSGYLVEVMERQGVTVLQMVPSMLGVLLGEGGLRERCTKLRRVFSGGEALTWEMQERFFAMFGEAVELVNLYGPTEASIDATFCRCERVGRRVGQTVPIGRPLANVQVYILDRRMNPVVRGLEGELYIGGVGLARGYAGRAELTAEKFVPNPFSASAGARLYRTGDVARYLADGRVEFVGRVDQQVKIRGYRIETGEIEAALSAHPSVRQSVVVAREDAAGEKRLVAYLAVGAANEIEVSEWRAYLKERVPEYMIPSAFVALAELPLTPNGKLDKKALPSPEEVRPQSGKEFVAPRTPVEEMLAEAWADVLHLPQVGVFDNFFDLGGDSIRSIQVKALAQKRGVDFSIEQLFQHQTIAGLAQELQTADGSHAPASLAEAFNLISEEDRLRLPPDIEDAYPLAQLQAGMLFHREYSPGSALYHDISSYHLKGRLDIEALRRALRQLAANHPALRTSFDLTSYSEPLQLVHRQADIPLEEYDLSHLSEAEQRDALDGWMSELTLRLFDLSEPPLLRFMVHRRGAETFQFTMNCHHAILDGWSVAVMVSELFHLYFNFLNAQTPAPAPPAVTYRDFVELEKKALASDASGDYWMQRLSDSVVTTMPRLAAADTASPEHKRQPIVREIIMSREVNEGLRQLARAAGTPLRSVMLAAHLRVLSLVGGRADVITGLVSNCRPEEADGERALGLFLNTVPFRMKVAQGSWVELVRETFAAEREMLPHRWFPLAEIQQRTGVRPLFEAVFNFINFHVYESVSGFEEMQALASRTFEQTNYPLTASFIQDSTSQQITVGLECDASIFNDEQVRDVLQYYVKTLETMSAEPESRHDNCAMLSDAERHRLLREWNYTRADYSLEHTLHHLFERQVERTPDALALISDQDQHTLSYAQLDERANRLAHLLIASGLAPESRVALLLERSTEMLISILAVLKAGAAYLPLDPEHPAERLSYMLSDAAPALLIADSSFAGSQVNTLTTVPVLALDTMTDALARQPATRPEVTVDPDALAYLIYTSGSTGTPKAVCVSHRSINNRLLWMHQEFPLFATDRVLQKTAYSFDASIWEMFLPLLCGAQVVLARAGGQRDSGYLVEVMERQGVTVLQMVPSMLGVLLGEGGLRERCTKLRRVFSGGEALTWEMQERFFSVMGEGVELVNLYGPTEASIDASFRRCRLTDPHQGKVMIGRPIANMELYVLDERQRLVPVGVAGELYIGGVGLARGYAGRAEMTAERFVPHPFSGSAGGRMYRTGDVVRRMSDGELEYVGRADSQVKVRGYRIELGEVEGALREEAGVREAVVIAREEEGGEKRLVAYVVADSGDEAASEFSPAGLRRKLAATLPEYMIPSAVVVLEKMPRLTNSKIDRNALPAPESLAQASNGSYVAPRSPVEEVVAGIWAHALRVEQLGVNDNFFSLGGQSLTATQVVSRIRETFQVEMPLRTLFDEPTVEGLSRYIEAARQADGGLQSPPVGRVSREGDLPLSFAQQRLWFLDRLEPGSPAYNIATGIRLKGALDVGALRQSLDAILRRHESLRTTFATVKGRPVQIINPPFNLDVPLFDLRSLPEAEREAEMRRQAGAEARQPFDLTRGPLLRMKLWQLADDEHVALLTVHHIVSDGWSIGVFVDELSSLYEAYTQERSPELAELPVQYADYAAWQRGWLQGEALDAQFAYWRRQLEGAPAFVELPTDHPRPAAQTINGVNFDVMFPKPLTDALKALSRREGASLFITLLAAFQTLINRYTGQERVVVGTDVANRNHGESEKLIGFFVNQLVLHANLSGDPRFRELLRHVRDLTLDAYAHQDLPFDKLVELLQPERDLSRTPLFQLKLVFQNTPLQPLQLSGLTLAPLDLGIGTATHDLTLFMEDTEQGLSLTFQYNSDLFEPLTMQRLSENFELLLTSIVERPDAHLSELKAILDQAERERQRKAKSKLEASNLQRFKKLKPKSVRI